MCFGLKVVSSWKRIQVAEKLVRNKEFYFLFISRTAPVLTYFILVHKYQIVLNSMNKK